jgi:protein-tyrosine phosphatase
MKKLLLFLVVLTVITSIAFGLASYVQKFSSDQVQGKGPLPYNYRIIDQNIHAGGHPMRPTLVFYGNNDKQVLGILEYLKSNGVSAVINLDGNLLIHNRYKKLLAKAGIEEIFVPMHAAKVPTTSEWEKIKAAMEQDGVYPADGGVYIHCKWGADRSGSIVAKYLVEVKGYDPKQAWQAVISGGSHAGAMGGLKKGRAYRRIVQFFWPKLLEDNEAGKYYK